MKKCISIFLSAVIIATFLSGCGSSGDKISVTSAKVKNEDTVSNSYTANLEATDKVTVVPKLSVQIKTVNFKVGDSVKSGDVLFTMDSQDIENNVTQAKAAYESAVTAYNNTEGGTASQTKTKLQQAISAAQIDLSNAQKAYALAKSNSDSKSDIAAAQSAYDSAELSYEKEKYLVSVGEDSDFALQQAENSMNSAKAALQNAQTSSQNNLIAAEYKLQSAQTELASAKQNLSLTVNTLIPESIASAKAQVDTANAALDTATSALDNTKVTAPISGVISSINATVGEMASPQTTSVTIINQSSVDLVVSVTSAIETKLKSGMSVDVAADGIQQTLAGTISTISPSGNSSDALFDVKIVIPNSDGQLKDGMTATAKFNTDTSSQSLYVPIKSVIKEEDGSAYVYKVSGNKAIKTAVTLGSEKNSYVAVTSGLTKDDSIVVEGADKVSDNSSLNIVTSND